MSTDKSLPQAVADVQKLFAHGTDGVVFLRGSFVNYSVDLPFAFQSGHVVSPSGNIVSRELRHIVWDLSNIGALIERLERTDLLAATGGLDPGVWRQFCSLDIEHFHIEIRSILDYAARCVAAVGDQRGTVPSDSMNKLVNWLKKNLGNQRRLGEELATIVDAVPRFPDIREVRDEVIHRGGVTLVYGKPGTGLLFQIHKQLTPLIKPGLCVTEEGLVDFRLYGSLLLAELLLFLESLAETLARRLPGDRLGIKDAQMKAIGWEVFLEWLTRWSTQPTR